MFDRTPDDPFYRSLLRAIGAPSTTNNMALLYAWRQTEGGSATYNPFNTTKKMPGSTLYATSTHGVQNYATPRDGLAATVETLLLPKYAGVVASLKADKPASETAAAILSSPWGTGKLLRDVLAMHERGKFVVAPIATVPGAPPIYRLESSLTNAPKQLVSTLRTRRRGVSPWVWAGGTVLLGTLLLLTLRKRR